jgi:hypothetical protein
VKGERLMAERPTEEHVNVEAVMEEIRRKVREEFHGDYDAAQLNEDLQYVLDNCQLSHERSISSHRRVIGRFLTWARRLLYAEIRRSLDPALDKQTQWNRRAARALRWQQAEIERLRRALREPGGPLDIAETAPEPPPSSETSSSP